MGPGSVTGIAVVTSDGHGGVRVLAGGGDCVDCSWRLVRCEAKPSNAGGPGLSVCTDRGVPECEVPGTGADGTWYARLFSATGPAGPWEDRGYVCVGPGETPVSTDALFAQVRSYVDRLIPAAPQVSMQPAGTTIVRLPTLFQAGQDTDPGNVTTSKIFFADAGGPIAMNVTVTPIEWTWHIDGDTTMIGRDYCCRYYTPNHSPRQNPDYYASNTFTTTGSHIATVTVTWQANVTISGLGTVPVDGTFTRDSPAYPFQVKQARSQLEAGG